MKPFYKCSNKSNRFHLKMESSEETAAAIVASLLVKRNKKKRKRSVWVKPWLRTRIDLGLYEILVQEPRRQTVLLGFCCSLLFCSGF